MRTKKVLVAIAVMFLMIYLIVCEYSREVLPILNITIKTDKHEYLQLEPIRVTVFLENDSETEFSIKHNSYSRAA